ncbi:hypothetical protein DDZ14_14135 [Maritimibacter sp. 55A14]|uniref:hypothetical protein n=1 Tax=Maritimibacter sp. 55A14 TaxID=2174844 RepID=UPI000D618A86|nr:hypothetical protein [Maritimibacter sp. 55A14]PWE31158.1 hypothetical protein DDZ14_14135 [Maritimibacter sp. 55A14]
MTSKENPKVLTYRFHEFRPSDRKALKGVLAEDGGSDLFVEALRIYLRKWADSDWLTEYDIERVGQWTVMHFPQVAQSVEDMAKKELASARNAQAKKTYKAMKQASHTEAEAV